MLSMALGCQTCVIIVEILVAVCLLMKISGKWNWKFTWFAIPVAVVVRESGRLDCRRCASPRCSSVR